MLTFWKASEKHKNKSQTDRPKMQITTLQSTTSTEKENVDAADVELLKRDERN